MSQMSRSLSASASPPNDGVAARSVGSVRPRKSQTASTYALHQRGSTGRQRRYQFCNGPARLADNKLPGTCPDAQQDAFKPRFGPRKADTPPFHDGNLPKVLRHCVEVRRRADQQALTMHGQYITAAACHETLCRSWITPRFLTTRKPGRPAIGSSHRYPGRTWPRHSAPAPITAQRSTSSATCYRRCSFRLGCSRARCSISGR